MNTTETTRRAVPNNILSLPFNERWQWARTSSRMSHDRIVEVMGRSNRGHLIKIEKGDHVPRADLRDAYADATNVPRDLFADDQEVALSGETFRDGDGSSGSTPRARRAAARKPQASTSDDLAA